MASSDLVYCVCVIHLVICIVYLAELVPGDQPLQLGGVLIFPQLQWINAAFQCISIVSIIMAGVGNLYIIQSHLDWYFNLLRLSILGDIALIVVFAIFGQGCTSTQSANQQHFTATLQCSFSSGWVIVCLVLLLVFKCFGTYTVYQARRSLRTRYNDELVPYLSKRAEFGPAQPQPAMEPQPAMPAFPGTTMPAAQPGFVPARPAAQPASLSFRSSTDPRAVVAAPGFEYGTVMKPATSNSAPAVTAVPSMTY